MGRRLKEGDTAHPPRDPSLEFLVRAIENSTANSLCRRVARAPASSATSRTCGMVSGLACRLPQLSGLGQPDHRRAGRPYAGVAGTYTAAGGGLRAQGSEPAVPLDLHALREGRPTPVNPAIGRMRHKWELSIRARSSARVGEGEREVNRVAEMYRRIGLGDEAPWRHYLAAFTKIDAPGRGVACSSDPKIRTASSPPASATIEGARQY